MKPAVIQGSDIVPFRNVLGLPIHSGTCLINSVGWVGVEFDYLVDR